MAHPGAGLPGGQAAPGGVSWVSRTSSWSWTGEEWELLGGEALHTATSRGPVVYCVIGHRGPPFRVERSMGRDLRLVHAMGHVRWRFEGPLDGLLSVGESWTGGRV